jgi:hypothetical protein
VGVARIFSLLIEGCELSHQSESEYISFVPDDGIGCQQLAWIAWISCKRIQTHRAMTSRVSMVFPLLAALLLLATLVLVMWRQDVLPLLLLTILLLLAMLPKLQLGLLLVLTALWNRDLPVYSSRLVSKSPCTTGSCRNSSFWDKGLVASSNPFAESRWNVSNYAPGLGRVGSHRFQ